jgi:hypothetical protein
MGLRDTILATTPTSYWPLDDQAGASCHDEMSLHDASVPDAGIKLPAIPFGPVSVPYFDGEIGSYLTVADDLRYSDSYANALSVTAWNCPLPLDNINVTPPLGRSSVRSALL